jgi:hypothetical protein
MKTSIDLPDDLYRRVKSKSALEGKAVREVATALFTAYADEGAEADGAASQAPEVPGSEVHNVESWLRAFHEWGARVSAENPGGGFVAQLRSDRR